MAEQSSGQNINASLSIQIMLWSVPALLQKSNFSYQHKQQMVSYPKHVETPDFWHADPSLTSYQANPVSVETETKPKAQIN